MEVEAWVFALAKVGAKVEEKAEAKVKMVPGSEAEMGAKLRSSAAAGKGAGEARAKAFVLAGAEVDARAKAQT